MSNCSRHDDEKFFLTAENKKEFVPNIHDPPTREISVVVPSYNEEERCKNKPLFFCITCFIFYPMNFSSVQLYLNWILLLWCVFFFLYSTINDE